MTFPTELAVPNFGLQHRLQLAIEVAGMHPDDMAAELGLSVTTIRNYLKGRTVPTRAVITAWALRCQVDRDWLTSGTTDVRFVASGWLSGTAA